MLLRPFSPLRTLLAFLVSSVLVSALLYAGWFLLSPWVGEPAPLRTLARSLLIFLPVQYVTILLFLRREDRKYRARLAERSGATGHLAYENVAKDWGRDSEAARLQALVDRSKAAGTLLSDEEK